MFGEVYDTYTVTNTAPKEAFSIFDRRACVTQALVVKAGREACAAPLKRFRLASPKI